MEDNIVRFVKKIPPISNIQPSPSNRKPFRFIEGWLSDNFAQYIADNASAGSLWESLLCISLQEARTNYVDFFTTHFWVAPFITATSHSLGRILNYMGDELSSMWVDTLTFAGEADPDLAVLLQVGHGIQLRHEHARIPPEETPGNLRRKLRHIHRRNFYIEVGNQHRHQPTGDNHDLWTEDDEVLELPALKELLNGFASFSSMNTGGYETQVKDNILTLSSTFVYDDTDYSTISLTLDLTYYPLIIPTQ